MKIFILNTILFLTYSIKGNFGYVLNNCSDLSISKKKVNFDYFIYSEEKQNKNFRTAQANKGEILEINNNETDENFYSVFHDSFFYLKNGKLEKKYYIEKKNIKILNKKEIEIYKNTILKNKKAFLKKNFKNFLVGKMFFLENEKKKNNKYLNCFFFDENFKKINLKLNKSFLEERSNIYFEKSFIKKNEKKIRKKIINFLESLTNKKNKIIPYSFGGTTIWKKMPKNFFKKKIFDNKIIYISKKNKLKNEEKSGIDCSGLVNLTLRLFGIPFNLRNTETFKIFLKKVKNYNELESGDLLWIPGHIFFVDKEKNLLYESGGYSGNINGVVKNKISKRINCINTFQEFFNLKNFSLKNNKKIINNFCFLKSF